MWYILSNEHPCIKTIIKPNAAIDFGEELADSDVGDSDFGDNVMLATL